MSSNFDPYREWLGVPKSEQPPNFYRLLGIQLLESDLAVIDRAADRAMLYLKTLMTGENGHHAARMLSEVSIARATLLNPARKAAYDAQFAAPPASVPPPIRVAADVAPTSASAIGPIASHQRPLAATPARPGRKPNQPKALASVILAVVQIVFGGAGGLAIATLALWMFLGKDPLGLFNAS
jgi:hypothetical protein